jgi:hypothetical protein
MSFEVITYATHSERMFPQLMNNDYPIKVLGFGVKWESFITKIKGVLSYVKTKSPDDIVVCIDAFDVAINGDPSKAEQMFKDMDCGFLVSLDIEQPLINMGEVRFGTCLNGKTANMGLWMGYVKYIIPILEDIIKLPCNDDQINFNTVCSSSNHSDHIKMDMERQIFHNTQNKELVTDSIFIGYPGSVDAPAATKRFFVSNLPFLIIHISLIFYILLTLLPSHFRTPLLVSYAVLFTIFIFISNKHCTWYGQLLKEKTA